MAIRCKVVGTHKGYRVYQSENLGTKHVLVRDGKDTVLHTYRMTKLSQKDVEEIVDFYLKARGE